MIIEFLNDVDNHFKYDRLACTELVANNYINAGFAKIVEQNQEVDDSSNPVSKADLVDITSPTIIYEGYKRADYYRICKIDLSTTVIARTWATGQWTDRSILTYN